MKNCTIFKIAIKNKGDNFHILVLIISMGDNFHSLVLMISKGDNFINKVGIIVNAF